MLLEFIANLLGLSPDVAQIRIHYYIPKKALLYHL